MEHREDVERLFSWLKTPMVNYREFAPKAEVAEAVAAWPVIHKAAVESGVTPEAPAPQGDTVARERLARFRMTMPAAASTAPPAPEPVAPSPAVEPAPAATPTAGRLADQPSAPPPNLAQRIQAAVEGAAPRVAAPMPPPPHAAQPVQQAPAEPEIAGFEEGPPLDPPPQPAYAADPEAQRYYPPRERGGPLFGGEYREPPPGARAPGRSDRSLDAVFSRLSGQRDGLPDPRSRARTNPGLGTVFNRLR